MYKALEAELALLTQKIEAESKQKSEKGLVDKSFDWDEKSLSLEDDGTTTVKAFMAIAEDDPILNLDNESLKGEVTHLKKVFEKWTFDTFSLDQLLNEQVRGNVFRALGERGKRKDTNSLRDVVFIKAKDSPIKNSPECAFDTESLNDNHDHVPPLPKLSRGDPFGTPKGVTSIDLAQNYIVSDKTKRPSSESHDSPITNDHPVTSQLNESELAEPRDNGLIDLTLGDIYKMLDQGGYNDATLNQRSMLMKELYDLNSIEALEDAKKDKVQWSIEGDKNSKYFHGILNNKRSQLAIRGILVNGECLAYPSKVKSEFLKHFTNRFSKVESSRITLDHNFLNRLSIEKTKELERNVSYDETKRAVWDYGMNKSLLLMKDM
nr:RNA-directed DNA polymerase, eukaryota [Tanacetum cinerariifolium]